MSAAVGVVRSLPLANGFLAVEKQQLDRERISACLQHARHLDEERGARAAIVRANEAELAVPLRVEVARNDDAVLAGAWDGRAEIDHVDWAGRRGVVPGLFDNRNVQLRELGFDVLTGLLDRGRAGGTGTQGHELAEVAPRATRVEARCTGGRLHQHHRRYEGRSEHCCTCRS